MVEKEIKRAINIYVYEENEAPEILFTGTWRMRDINQIQRHILRAFDRDRKNKIVESKSKEMEDDSRE